MSLRQLDSRYYAVCDELRVLRVEGGDILDPDTFAALLIEQQTLRQRRDKANGVLASILHATCS